MGDPGVVADHDHDRCPLLRAVLDDEGSRLVTGTDPAVLSHRDGRRRHRRLCMEVRRSQRSRRRDT